MTEPTPVPDTAHGSEASHADHPPPSHTGRRPRLLGQIARIEASLLERLATVQKEGQAAIAKAREDAAAGDRAAEKALHAELVRMRAEAAKARAAETARIRAASKAELARLRETAHHSAPEVVRQVLRMIIPSAGDGNAP